MAKSTIALPDEMNDRIESDLAYGDSKSEWIRQGIRYRFLVDEILDEDLEDEKKLQAVEEALRDYVEGQ